MTSSWGSPFRLGEIVGAVSGAIQTVERSIDKAIGIPEAEAKQGSANLL
jgi:hypothetical protein